MLFWKRKKKSDDNTEIKVIRPIIETTHNDEGMTIAVTGFKEVITTVGEQKIEKEEREREKQVREKKEKERIERNTIFDIAISLFSLKELYESNYHKSFLDNFQSFKSRHSVLLHIAEKVDYSHYKEKAIEFYREQYEASLEAYQYDYLNNPVLLDLPTLEVRCFENTYCQFRDNWDFQLNEYKQKAAKKKRLYYLIEHTDIFISIAEEMKCSQVVLLANEKKGKYFSMLETI